MTQEEKNDLINNYSKEAKRFLAEDDYPKNENGVYLFTSADGSCSISLDMVLQSFKDWLIEEELI